MVLVKASDQSISARYEYGPFGETLVVEENGVSNPFHFSTKYLDSETGLYYYGYRYYNPMSGRWLSRDPIGERGGVNLYGFVKNQCQSGFDYLGLKLEELEVNWNTVTTGGNGGGKAEYLFEDSYLKDNKDVPKVQGDWLARGMVGGRFAGGGGGLRRDA